MVVGTPTQQILHQFQGFLQVPYLIAVCVIRTTRQCMCSRGCIAHEVADTPQSLVQVRLGRFDSPQNVGGFDELVQPRSPPNAGLPWPLSWHLGSPRNPCQTTGPPRQDSLLTCSNFSTRLPQYPAGARASRFRGGSPLSVPTAPNSVTIRLFAPTGL